VDAVMEEAIVDDGPGLAPVQRTVDATDVTPHVKDIGVHWVDGHDREPAAAAGSDGLPLDLSGGGVVGGEAEGQDDRRQ